MFEQKQPLTTKWKEGPFLAGCTTSLEGKRKAANFLSKRRPNAKASEESSRMKMSYFQTFRELLFFSITTKVNALGL